VPLAQRPREAELLAPAQLPVLLVVLVVAVLLPQQPEVVVRLQPLVPAELPLAVPVQLLSRQSFSAAMAGSTPRPRATYEPVPRSR
jgi:hypothetical protein